MTIHWKAVEQYFTVVLFVFQFYSDCNFYNFLDQALSEVKGQRIKTSIDHTRCFHIEVPVSRNLFCLVECVLDVRFRGFKIFTFHISSFDSCTPLFGFLLHPFQSIFVQL